MSFSSRFTIIAAFFGILIWFLSPTYIYYVSTPLEIRNILESGEDYSTIDLDEQQKQDLDRALEVKGFAVSLGLDIKGGISILLEPNQEKLRELLIEHEEEYTDEVRFNFLDGIVDGLKSRINEFGLADISIRKIGIDRISLQIPGVQNLDRIMALIEQQGVLSFHFVDEATTSSLSTNPDTGELLYTPIGDDNILLFSWEKNMEGIYQKDTPLVLEKKPQLQGNVIKNAFPSRNEFGQVVVSFELTSDAGSQFSDITGNNIGKRLAIVLDDRILSTPSINTRIGSRGNIQGNFNAESARDLSLVLRSGSLPIPIDILSVNIVGPSMGKELLKRSFDALFYGFLLIILFIVFWYRAFGLIASFSIIVNALMIFAILAQMNFTITLPGMAGLLLTLGISIDASVIIFERIKDELKNNGNQFILAVDQGYQKAFWSIFDANITTLLTAFILAYYGDLLVEGFAFTIFVGVLSSMFSALFMTRLILHTCIYLGAFKKYKRWHI